MYWLFEKTKNKQKDARVGPFFNKRLEHFISVRTKKIFSPKLFARVPTLLYSHLLPSSPLFRGRFLPNWIRAGLEIWYLLTPPIQLFIISYFSPENEISLSYSNGEWAANVRMRQLFSDFLSLHLFISNLYVFIFISYIYLYVSLYLYLYVSFCY